MKYTAAFRLRGVLADAVAVEWTVAAAPQESNAGWEACVRQPNGDWRFADHDAAGQANWRDAGAFDNIGLRYRLSPSGPWSPISKTRKEIVLGDGAPQPEEPEEPEEEKPEDNPTPGVTVSSRKALMDAIVASRDGDTIKIAPGVYDRFIWPKNTSHRLTLAPAQLNNPPIMRGIYIGGSAPDWWPQGSSGWARNLTIDGLRFQAELLTSVKKADGSTVNIVDTDGRGYGWRADFTYPRVTNIGENAGFVGLGIKSGCQDIIVQNCLFEQYAKGMNIGDVARVTVRHNEFSEICEDGVIIWGGTDLNFQYNLWKNSRGVSLKAAQAYGWTDDSTPPHQDFFQIACNAASQFCTRLTISNNVMYDDTVRVHGVLLNNAYVGGSTDPALQGSRHKDVVVENNFLRQTHTTALQLTSVVGLMARRNKVIRSLVVNGSKKNDVAIVFATWGQPESGDNMENIVARDNVCRKFVGMSNRTGDPEWTIAGNVETNDENVMPAGWVEIRPDRATSGPRAGRYGQK